MQQKPLELRPASRLVVLARHTSSDGDEAKIEWRVAASVVVPSLPTPDQLVVQVRSRVAASTASIRCIEGVCFDERGRDWYNSQDSRIVVGSTLTSRIAVARMEISESADWDVAVVGEVVR